MRPDRTADPDGTFRVSAADPAGPRRAPAAGSDGTLRAWGAAQGATRPASLVDRGALACCVGRSRCPCWFLDGGSSLPARESWDEPARALRARPPCSIGYPYRPVRPDEETAYRQYPVTTAGAACRGGSPAMGAPGWWHQTARPRNRRDAPQPSLRVRERPPAPREARRLVWPLVRRAGASPGRCVCPSVASAGCCCRSGRRWRRKNGPNRRRDRRCDRCRHRNRNYWKVYSFDCSFTGDASGLSWRRVPRDGGGGAGTVAGSRSDCQGAGSSPVALLKVAA